MLRRLCFIFQIWVYSDPTYPYLLMPMQSLTIRGTPSSINIYIPLGARFYPDCARASVRGAAVSTLRLRSSMAERGTFT